MDEEKVLSEEELSDVSGGRILPDRSESKRAVAKGIKIAARVATGIAGGGGFGNILADTINSGALGGGLGGGLGRHPGGDDTNLQ